MVQTCELSTKFSHTFWFAFPMLLCSSLSPIQESYCQVVDDRFGFWFIRLLSEQRSVYIFSPVLMNCVDGQTTVKHSGLSHARLSKCQVYRTKRDLLRVVE